MPTPDDDDTEDEPGTIPDLAPGTPAEDPPFSGSIDEAFADIDEPAPVRRRPVDASVADILREEAALEAAARRRDTPGTLESQPELDLPESEAAPAVQDDVAAAVAETVAAASRKELLPDIEEINSTLRSSTERGETVTDDPDEDAQENRRGFRFGFTTVLGIIIVLALIYGFADQIGAAVPALADALAAYVDLVDRGRLWLDLKMQDLLSNMQAGDTPSGN